MRQNRPGSVGLPVPGVEVKLNDANREGIGEIIARGPNIMKGYYRKEKETAEILRGGWLYTGDVGIMDEDGYVYLIDRRKDMIISGGENIYSREVEDVLYQHPAVADAAVIGVPDEKWGESVKAIVVLKEGMKATEQELIDFCKARLASYKKPKSVEFYDSVPKTATGKIKKAEIREKYWAGKTRRIN